MVDKDIEEVYYDPLFTKQIHHLELKEYDFWYCLSFNIEQPFR